MRVQSIYNNYYASKYNAKPTFKAVQILHIYDFRHAMEVLSIEQAIRGGVRELSERENLEVSIYPCVNEKMQLIRLGISVCNILPKIAPVPDRLERSATRQIGRLEVGGATLTPNQILHEVVRLIENKKGRKIEMPDIPGGDKFPDDLNVDIIQAYERLQEALK